MSSNSVDNGAAVTVSIVSGLPQTMAPERGVAVGQNQTSNKVYV